jgi:hypothetical protein
MELVALVALVAVIFWWVGFFKSTRRLANIANRGATSLELEQLKSLKTKHDPAIVKELKTYAEEFDAL